MEEAHLKAVLDFWSAFDLDGKRLHLDKQGLLLQEAKDGSAKARKALGEMTRDFRRADDEQKLLTMNELLRAYQAEIDALTKRSKSAETNFFSLYRDLFEAPDPVPCLKRCLESVVTQGGAGASSTSSSSTNATTNSSTMSTSTSSDAQENRQRYLDEIAQLKVSLGSFQAVPMVI
jgi:homeobox protein cut-like